MQNGLTETVKLGETLKMTYNTEKCKHLHIGKSKDSKTTTVVKVLCEKDVAVPIDNNPSFTEHRCINSKIRRGNSFTYMDKEMFLALYKSIVRSHLEYANCIWTAYHKKDCIAFGNVQRCATIR